MTGKQTIWAKCSNAVCSKKFAYKYGARRYRASSNHYCSYTCRNQGRAERIMVTCVNTLCGKRFEFNEGRARFERATEHYCSRSCQNTTHGMAGSPRHKIWERTKKRAREKGIKFKLTVHDVPEVPSKCPVLGIKIEANPEAGPLDSSPSVDRIDPAKGYVPGNVRIISNRANRLRSDGTAEELRKVAADASNLERLAR